jgi:hypothetical protein
MKNIDVPKRTPELALNIGRMDLPHTGNNVKLMAAIFFEA